MLVDYIIPGLDEQTITVFNFIFIFILSTEIWPGSQKLHWRWWWVLRILLSSCESKSYFHPSACWPFLFLMFLYVLLSWSCRWRLQRKCGSCAVQLQQGHIWRWVAASLKCHQQRYQQFTALTCCFGVMNVYASFWVFCRSMIYLFIY